MNDVDSGSGGEAGVGFGTGAGVAVVGVDNCGLSGHWSTQHSDGTVPAAVVAVVEFQVVIAAVVGIMSPHSYSYTVAIGVYVQCSIDAERT